MDSETLRFISQEIALQLNVILPGSTGTTTVDTETIEAMFPGMPGITSRPVMHPFGISSRAPKGTISVVGRVGEHFGNRMVLGHRDKGRPAVQEGEVQLYNQFGQAIYLENGAVHVGKPSTSNPAVVGNETKALFQALIQWILTHTHITGAPGSPTSVTMQAADLQTILDNNVTNDKILSQLVFVEKEA